MDAYDHRVNERFKEWQLCRAKLRDLSLRLEHELRDYVAGTGPEPSDLTAQVQELRKECDGLFADVLKAMNDRTVSRQGKA